MARSGGISGLAVGMVTAGSVLVYAGLRDLSPLDALRDATTGHVPSVGSHGSAAAQEALANLAGQSGGAGSQAPSVLTSGSSLAAAAMKYVGGKYRFGGTDPATGLDCSGLVRRAFADIGVKGCPRTSAQQFVWPALTTVRRATDVQPGDLVFWLGHVAIATTAGATRVVGALNARVGVREGPIAQNGAGHVIGYRRYAGAQAAAPGAGGGGGW